MIHTYLSATNQTRHGHIVRKIAKELKNTHNTDNIWIERHWRSNLKLLKLDITMRKMDTVLLLKSRVHAKLVQSILNKEHVIKLLNINHS